MIRDANENDISRIAEILVFGKRVAYRDIFRDDRGSFNELSAAGLIDEYRADAQKLGEGLVYDDGIVKGMLSRRYDKARAELCELYVEPFFTGGGIGHALAEYFIAEARSRNIESVSLWVVSKNLRARRFYESLGFAFDSFEREICGTGVQESRYVLELR